MGAGRPPKYETVEELEAKIADYFDPTKNNIRCRKEYTSDGVREIPTPTISDLVIYLGFCDRAAFYDYEKIPKFCHTIKRARSLIEREYEMLLHSNRPTGAIFALKNFGWSDAQVIKDDEIDGELEFANIPKNGDGKDRLSKYFR